jgi:hypothetical protein
LTLDPLPDCSSQTAKIEFQKSKIKKKENKAYSETVPANPDDPKQIIIIIQ